MVKEIRPITFVRDLRDGLKKNFDPTPEPVKPPALLDAEGEALEPEVELARDAVADDDAAPLATNRRKRIARD